MAGSRLKELLGGPVVKKIHKAHGKGILDRASAFDSGPCPRIPTGIFMLDYALGGGWAVGNVNVSWGHKSSTKTTTYLRSIANAQKMCRGCWKFRPCGCDREEAPLVCFLDVEGTLDKTWAKRMGVDLDELGYSKPEYAEQTLDIAEALIRNGADVLCLDSLAFLTPSKEIEQSVAKETVGLQARLIGKGTRKFVAAINTVGNETGMPPTLLFTNQVRMKVGVMFGNPETQPGGLANGFASAIEVKLGAGKYEMDEILGQPVAAEFRYRVEKNKVSAARMQGEFKMYMADTEFRKVGDPMNEADMVSMGEKIGLVEGSGSSWSALGEKYKGKSKITQRLLEDPEFYAKMYAALMTILLAD